MAKLITPRQAYRAPGMKKGKWHLINPRRQFGTWAQSVCNQIITLKSTVEVPHEVKAVDMLKASEVCVRCCGPCELS